LKFLLNLHTRNTNKHILDKSCAHVAIATQRSEGLGNLRNSNNKETECKNCGKLFNANYDNQTCCSVTCLVCIWDRLPSKLRTKRLARGYSHTLGYKSMSEVKYKAFLDAHGIQNEYEPEVFKYTLPRGKYTPDFKVIKSSGQPVYLEYKGVFSGKDRRKLRYVRQSNPTLDLRLVFERSSNKLNKCSKTTYGEWATKNGFKWYNVEDINTLMKELENE